ncbi:hypothetical protein PA598K_03305 [Paenibacillus sp. 598K]|uniref:AAA family ATPase n=1 Tax=Paenibacillus sp. 598K TaxID=1117987 RepID=UPI000FF95077|nr:ATP-binding protein [Paenibacillus sp. 598K]GBF74932.1 hypothetical protein PA598K_03305 [Paenibacillus sp. 598K]
MTKAKPNARIPRAKGIDTATYYTPKECTRKVRRIVLPPDNRRIVDEFLTILAMKEKFEAYDVPIPNKLVMFGPPGTGKTLTAYYLAARLELPLVLVRLDAIIHSHLGETASNVRKIFEYAKASPCVLFLDEFDAIARTRDNNDEVKEMSRVVNTLLQCLDEFDGDSVCAAATNLETELDTAIWRRFDTKMVYTMPCAEARDAYIDLMLRDFAREPEVREQAAKRMEGCSYADMEQILLKAMRKAIIQERPLAVDHIDEAYAEYRPRPMDRAGERDKIGQLTR